MHARSTLTCLVFACWAITACANHAATPRTDAGRDAGSAGSGAHDGGDHPLHDAGSRLDAGADAARWLHDAQTAADGGSASHDDAATSDPFCAGQAGRCTKLCEGGNCSCHCECRSNAECGDAQFFTCVAPTDPSPPCCGVAPLCYQDSDCTSQGSGTPICNRLGCGFCISACTSDTDCGAGYRCRTDGHCSHERCDSDGVACPAQSHCAPSDAQADAFGCLHDACTGDAQCQGACVAGRCYVSGGRCAPILCP